MKKVGKILIVGMLTSVYRMMIQIPVLLLPAAKVSVEPSVFVKNGTVGGAFIVFAFMTYSILAALYLLVIDNIEGNRVSSSFKYGGIFCLFWVAYLIEPTEIGGSIWDAIAYPLADGSALLIMGLLLAWQFGRQGKKQTNPNIETSKKAQLAKILIPFICFLLGRLVLYWGFHVSSQWDTRPVWSVFFLIECGLIVSACLQWLTDRIKAKTEARRCLVSGSLMFGTNLFIFNAFVLLIFSVNIWDVLIRTVVDTVAFTVGLLLSRKVLQKFICSQFLCTPPPH
jgi:hypothetical protein